MLAPLPRSTKSANVANDPATTSQRNPKKSLKLACPARFERATYALEAVKMRLNNSRNNDIKVLAFGVQ